MIKIIKHGLIRKVTCGECECVFTFEHEDIIHCDQRQERDYVKCPDCGKIICLDCL